MRPYFSLLLSLLIIFSCTNDDAGQDRKRRTPVGAVYADYQVWAEEGAGNVTVRLQYRSGDEEGEAFAVEGPGKVLLDGEELTADSTRFMGVFYEAQKPIEEFKGKHQIVFVDKNGKEHQETFNFETFSLANELPENIRKRPFQIQLQNFPQKATPVRLVMVDTSLHSDGVNEELVIENGVIEITESYLSNLTNGPVTIEIYLEEERPVTDGARNQGRFLMIFGLRRQFNLVN